MVIAEANFGVQHFSASRPRFSKASRRKPLFYQGFCLAYFF